MSNKNPNFSGAGTKYPTKTAYADNVKCLPLFYRKGTGSDGKVFYMSAVFLDDTIVPYYKGGPANKGKETDGEPFPITKGEVCHRVGQYGYFGDLTVGSVYSLSSLSTSNYKDKETGEELNSLTFRRAEHLFGLEEYEFENIVKTIPFKSRKIDVSRDARNYNRYDGDLSGNYRFLAIKVLPEMRYIQDQNLVKTGMVFGCFTVGNPRDTSVYLHQPQDATLPPMCVLRGQDKRPGVWYLYQESEEEENGEKKIRKDELLASVTIFESIERMQLRGIDSWVALAPYLYNALHGYMYCSIDKAGTNDLMDIDLAGPIQSRIAIANACFFPDMRATLKMRGIKLKEWASCVKLAPSILTADGKGIKAEYNTKLDYILDAKTFLNVLAFSGDISELIASPFVEFYVLTNLARNVFTDVMGNDDGIVAKLLNQDTFQEANEIENYEIYAVLSDNAPSSLYIWSLISHEFNRKFNVVYPNRSLVVVGGVDTKSNKKAKKG